jgi:hypothetical protein
MARTALAIAAILLADSCSAFTSSSGVLRFSQTNAFRSSSLSSR